MDGAEPAGTPSIIYSSPVNADSRREAAMYNVVCIKPARIRQILSGDDSHSTQAGDGVFHPRKSHKESCTGCRHSRSRR